MSLGSGARLGPYEVVSALGAGGMGEVYRARHTKLDRHVALKILPAAFATDPERLARFEREAKTLASLNHPNIASLHGFEDSGGVQALVMELVEGPTLADRIGQGPIPLEEAMAIAKQIADALEAAHEQGIVHRDLKPANIKVRDDGTVKVLDFGLAKALGPAEAGHYVQDGRSVRLQADLSHSPTITSPVGMTGVGVILGTAAYMAPEQARGKAVDKRADIWAFGCVVYEMLTGKRAFEGAETTDVLARIIERDPDFTALPSTTPPAIRRLLSRCLEKDRKRRLADVADARFEIEEAGDPARADQLPTRRATSVRARVAWSIAVAVVAVLSVLTFRFFQQPADPIEMRLQIVTPTTTESVSFAISPDSRMVVFEASEDGVPRLWLRPIDSLTARPLLGTESARYPFWSPDGKSVAFLQTGSLKRIDIDGGAPQMLAGAGGFAGGSWGLDGTILFATSTRGQLSRTSASGGEVIRMKFDTTGALGSPRFLPDGRHFLVYVSGTSDAPGIYLGSLDSDALRRLTAADSTGDFAPPRWLLFVREGRLVARRFDVDNGNLVGDPLTVADSVGSFAGGAFSVSTSGLIAYRTTGTILRQLSWFDRSGRALGMIGVPEERMPGSVSLSHDGRRAAVHGTIRDNADIWIIDARRTPITFDASNDTYPIWSPDDGTIVFDSNRNGGVRNLYRKRSNGTGNEELLLASSLNKAAADWSRDGRFILYSVNDPKTGWDLWVLPLEADGKIGNPSPYLSTNFRECCGQFSPNRRWIAYESDKSGHMEIYVRSFAESGGESLVSTEGGIQSRWSADGKELYYIAPDGSLMAVRITESSGELEAGAPVKLFPTRIWGGGTSITTRQQYDVTADGRFLINVYAGEPSDEPITLLLNWKPPSDK